MTDGLKCKEALALSENALASSQGHSHTPTAQVESCPLSLCDVKRHADSKSFLAFARGSPRKTKYKYLKVKIFAPFYLLAKLYHVVYTSGVSCINLTYNTRCLLPLQASKRQNTRPGLFQHGMHFQHRASHWCPVCTERFVELEVAGVWMHSQLVASLLLVAMPGAPSSVLAP